nr:ADP-ribosylglycohydrolase family protein [uncultured Oscillibacter sp.]
MKEQWFEKIYAGFLGMDAGMRLGAPVENPWWTYERLRDYFGDIRGYLREYKTHPADDDINGPVIFLRALLDSGGLDFTQRMAGETWLNYTRCGRGMFWWGGEDVSTEHRAYMNLKRGLTAPDSGSIAQNGAVAAEQIGGQIFVDTWGLICPGRPEQAAAFARRMASVSHDGEALHGAAFMAACIAAAFTCESVEAVIDAGLRQIPGECVYRRVVDAVRAFHASHPGDFRACRDYVDREWGNDKFPGGYHIIPNAGICVLALLYGENDLGRTIEVSCMCGFDTDCNASNVGTIMGVLHGLEGVPERYRRPINDSAVLSSVSGYLNMLDIPTFAKELAETACRLRGETVPGWAAAPRRGELAFNFAFPGSTHGLELSDRASHELRWVSGGAHSGRGCLELEIDGKSPAPADLYFRACCIRSDFNDERYDPVFSPRVYPGQSVRCWMRSCQTAPAAITVTPYVTRAMAGDRIDLCAAVLPEGEWTEIAFSVPDLGGDQAHDIGWKIEIAPVEPPWACGKVYVDDITVSGPMDYTIDPAVQRMEFGQPTPFSVNDGEAFLAEGALRVSTRGDGQVFTGNYYACGASVEAGVTVLAGTSAGLLLRGQGCRRYYALGFSGENRISIDRWDGGQRTELAAAPFSWERGRPCRLAAEARGETLTLRVDGELVLTARDGRFSYGMAGVCHGAAGESVWTDFHIRADTAGCSET